MFRSNMANNGSGAVVGAVWNDDANSLLPRAEEDGLEDSAEGVQKSDDEPGASWMMSSFIVMNAALGAGILNFPAAFDTAGGILVATIVHLFLLVLAAASLLTLGWCSDVRRTSNYQDTVDALCGKWGRRACSMIVVCYCYFTCITFLVVVGDQSDTVFHDIFGLDFCHHWYMSRRFIVPLTAILFIWPLCYAKNIDFLKYPSGVATIGIFYLTGLTVYVYFTTDTSNVIVKKGPEVWSDVFSVVPPIMFAYQMHVSVIPVYARVRPHNLPNYAKMFSVTLLVCFIAYTTVGTFGYLTFGTSIQEDLFSSYSTKNRWVMAGFVLFTIKTLLTYPILNFCGRLAVESVYDEIRGLDALQLSESDKRRMANVVSTVWFLSSLVVAIFVPNIASVVDFLGCLATCFILVFPGICLIRAHVLFENVMPDWKARLVLTVGCIFVVVGFFIFGMTLAQSIEFNLSTAQPKHGKLLCP